jgi:hypothetical protein
MPITIGIPTFNRLDMVKKMAASLYRSDCLREHHIRIYDDCSTEYGISDLKKLFPTAVSITRNRSNIKADMNMYKMYEDFLESPDEYFFNADSDLIFHSQWIPKALHFLNESEGILSLFNSGSHPEKSDVANGLCVKETVGAAGTLFIRKRVEEIVERFPTRESARFFDWKWSSLFTSNNIPLYCTKESLVQHIGYYGENSIKSFFDYGKGFEIDSKENGQIINDIFEQFVDQNKKEYEKYSTDSFYKIRVFSDIKYRQNSISLSFIARCFMARFMNDIRSRRKTGPG